MGKSTTQLRQLWRDWECKEGSMVVVPFGPDRIRVAPPTAEAWGALAAVMLHHGYRIRTTDTDSYNCRQITGGSGRSLHSYGIALDVNWTTNPYIDHTGTRKVRFSDKPTQEERAIDVKEHRADTDMTPEMIEDILAIKTEAGVQIFDWGGNFTSVKDSMHFELDLSPADLAKGIDFDTVKGWNDAVTEPDIGTAGVGEAETGTAVTPGLAEDPHVVIARSGLRLRSAASETADVIKVVPEGTRVNVLSREGQWALVDLAGDRRADGFTRRASRRPAHQAHGVPERLELA